MSDVLDKKLNLPRGLSPVVFVFDDASPEQFRYVNNNGKLEIDPTSGMGIWLDFKRRIPDWDNKSVYCLLSGASAGHNFFGDRGIQGQKSSWRFQKVKWLADNGFELCDHTVWHAQDRDQIPPTHSCRSRSRATRWRSIHAVPEMQDQVDRRCHRACGRRTARWRARGSVDGSRLQAGKLSYDSRWYSRSRVSRAESVRSDVQPRRDAAHPGHRERDPESMIVRLEKSWHPASPMAILPSSRGQPLVLRYDCNYSRR